MAEQVEVLWPGQSNATLPCSGTTPAHLTFSPDRDPAANLRQTEQDSRQAWSRGQGSEALFEVDSRALEVKKLKAEAQMPSCRGSPSESSPGPEHAKDLEKRNSSRLAKPTTLPQQLLMPS